MNISNRNILKPYIFIIPAFIVITLSGILPVGMVLHYSLHDSFPGGNFIWVGLDWFKKLFTSSDFVFSLFRSFLFSFLALLIQIPLGIFIAKKNSKVWIFSKYYNYINCNSFANSKDSYWSYLEFSHNSSNRTTRLLCKLTWYPIRIKY